MLINLQQRRQEYTTGKKTVPSISGARKIQQVHVKD